jgi:hypothetical protein
MASYAMHPSAHLSYFTSVGRKIYFLKRGVFRIDLQNFPHRQWVALSNTSQPNDFLDHRSDAMLLLEDGDLVHPTGDHEHTTEVRLQGEQYYLVRVKVTVTLLIRERLPVSGIMDGWITLYPQDTRTEPTPNSVLQWVANARGGRHTWIAQCLPLLPYASPEDCLPRTPPPPDLTAPPRTRNNKRLAHNSPMATPRPSPPAQLTYFVNHGLRCYFLEQGIFRINLQNFPHRQWVPLSSASYPNEHQDHRSEALFLLEDGDLVSSTGDLGHTRELWVQAELLYFIRVKVTVSRLNRERLPLPRITEGWITLYPQGADEGGMITHVARNAPVAQPESVLQWFAKRHHGWAHAGPVPDFVPPGDCIPRTPSPVVTETQPPGIWGAHARAPEA